MSHNSEPIISYSGIRFLGHRPEFVSSLAHSYARFLDESYSRMNKGTILIARDTRPKSMDYVSIFEHYLKDYNLFDLGIVPTPTLHWAMKNLFTNVVGGVMVTASHNSKEWNGLKILQPNGLCLEWKDIRHIHEISLNKFGEIPGVYKQYSLSMPVTNEYLDVLIKEIPGNYSGIRVAVDTCNGAAREILPKLLRAYGCDVFQVDSLNDNGLSRHPHPIAEHLSDLSSLVKSKKCDIGFAADSDGDRLAIVDNNGNVLDEPYTTAFSFWHMLKNMHSDTKNVVVNMSTSRRIDDLVNALGGNIIKAHVGELKVAQAIKKYNACIGGEPSCAGVVYPKMGYVRDGQVAAAFALSLISHENKPISELIQSMPGNSKDYFMAQASELFLEDIQPILNEIADKYSSAGELNTLDGLRVDSNDFWFHVRRSNTEPIIRIITEATKKEKAYAILEDLKSFFSV